MPKFNYDAMDSSGNLTNGTLDADSSSEAISRLRTMRLTPTKIVEVSKEQVSRPWWKFWQKESTPAVPKVEQTGPRPIQTPTPIHNATPNKKTISVPAQNSSNSARPTGSQQSGAGSMSVGAGNPAASRRDQHNPAIREFFKSISLDHKAQECAQCGILQLTDSGGIAGVTNLMAAAQQRSAQLANFVAIMDQYFKHGLGMPTGIQFMGFLLNFELTTCPNCQKSFCRNCRETTAHVCTASPPDKREYDPNVGLSGRVKALARDPGQKIAAVAAYRQESGAGLAQALEAIEKYIGGSSTAPDAGVHDPTKDPSELVKASDAMPFNEQRAYDPSIGLSERVMSLARKGNRIEAIAAYRQETGANVAEGVEVVKKYLESIQPVESSDAPAIASVPSNAPTPGAVRIIAGIEFVWCPPGTFQMGAPDSEPGAVANEMPSHSVTISRGFWIGKYPVTQEQWENVMGSNNSYYRGAKLPVEQVAWTDCFDFLCRPHLQGCGKFTLPTESQWEYACRAGSTGPYCFGNDISQLGSYGWFRENSGGRTHPVGLLAPNAWGLYDMHGNVSEWCMDWFGPYQPNPQADPVGPMIGKNKLLRGGSWYCPPHLCRAAMRENTTPDTRDNFIGFRLLWSES